MTNTASGSRAQPAREGQPARKGTVRPAPEMMDTTEPHVAQRALGNQALAEMAGVHVGDGELSSTPEQIQRIAARSEEVRRSVQTLRDSAESVPTGDPFFRPVVVKVNAPAVQRHAGHGNEEDVPVQRSLAGRTGSLLVVAPAVKQVTGRPRVQRHDDMGQIEQIGSVTKDELDESREAGIPAATTDAPGVQQQPSEGKGKKKGKSAKSGMKLSSKALDVTIAHDSIKSVFGKKKTGDIVSGEVTVVATRGELYTAYDKWMQANGWPDWRDGQKQEEDDAAGMELGGFAEPAPGTKIYVFAQHQDPATTIHEMLHVNTSPTFVTTNGRAVNEGVTQRLALKVLKAKRYSKKGSEGTYAEEQRAVNALVKIVPEATIIDSYFNDGTKLKTEFEKVCGADSWQPVVDLLEADKYDDGIALMKPVKKTKGAKSGGKGFFGKLFG